MRTMKALSTFHTIRTEGGLLPLDLLQRMVLEDKTLPGLTPEDFHVDQTGERLRDAMNRAWSHVRAVWKNFQAALTKLSPTDAATVLTRDKWLLPLFKALDYGQLAKASEEVIDGKVFRISHKYQHTPIHFVGCRVELDDPPREKSEQGGRGVSAHGLVQGFLNRSEGHLWGMVSNGYMLRLLRDHHSLTQQAYVEFDLQAMMEGEFFGEFCVLWLLCHQSRVEHEVPENCWLERWSVLARDEGVRALDKLRAGVEKAIEALGTGFLRHRSNKKLQEALGEGRTLDKQEYLRLLRQLVYRLIFMFVAEDREALCDPKAGDEARARYQQWYTTKRLRELADKRRGSAHGDLWQGLLLVMRKLERGAPVLALPALGSFLWRPAAIGVLGESELSNEFLLEALRALCYVEHQHTRYAVSFRNIGSEELGSVFEGLLELHPQLDRQLGTFTLSTAAGHERKTTGSYYTPRSLVECLLDSALDPVLEEAAKKGQDGILALRVCDPACGSGHFLVAAARRIAKKLAYVRTGGEEPSTKEVEHALRDVVGKCIYGVDLNPMAVELCKVSLWMEAIEPGRPLSFLEAHIQQGNALLGTTPALMEQGILDDAFEVLEGDDKEVAKRLKKRNKQERAGQTTMFSRFADGAPLSYGRLSAGAAAVEAILDDDMAGILKKEADWENLLKAAEYRDRLFLANAWCAAFVWPKEKGPLEDGAITQDLWLRMKKEVLAAPKVTRAKVEELAKDYSFFHWHLAFAQVFFPGGEGEGKKDTATGWMGGFDVVLGNPPWDTMSPDAKEFFSQYDPEIRNQSPADQVVTIARIIADPRIADHWNSTRRRLFSQVHFLKQSQRYVLYALGNLGKGDFNVFRSFVELALQIVREGGYASQVVPDGLYAGTNAMAIRQALFERFSFERLYVFENASGAWFQGVHRSQKFCIYSAQRGGNTKEILAAFGIRTNSELNDAKSGAHTCIPITMVRDFSPESLAIIEVRGKRDIEIVQKMYNSWPPLGERIPGTPHRSCLRELESGHEQECFTEDPRHLVHYEGRMIDQYDHRAKGYRSGRARSAVWADLTFGSDEKKIHPQWYVPRENVPLQARGRIDYYRVGFCDVASPTNKRSLVAAMLPPHCIAGHTVPTIIFIDGDAASCCIWLGIANSFTMDYLTRQKVSLHMTFSILDSLPFPRLKHTAPIVQRLMPLVLRLTCTGPEMTGYWNEMAQHGWVEPVAADALPPGLTDEAQRLLATTEIEAIVAKELYQLTRDELAYIMDTFPIVEKRDKQKFGSYRTKELVLEAYDRLAEAGA